MTPEAQRIAIAEKDRARSKVRGAVRSGKITKPHFCSKCLRRYPLASQIHAHHPNGYKRWDDIIWLCYKCHDKTDPTAKSKLGLSNGAHTKPGHRPRGNRHGKSVLTDDQVLEIRNSTEKGILLAKQFGVHPTTISKLRLGIYRI